MKSSKPTISLKSFEEMKSLLRNKSISFPASTPERPPKKTEKRAEPPPATEEDLFREAMEGVTRFEGKTRVGEKAAPESPPQAGEESESEPLLRLKDLVEYGTGFQVADTPEYIEGTMYQVDPEIARRLHRGDYSIQAYVNLHRMSIEHAREAFENFLKWAVTTGKNGVLVVHGRGLSSRDEPLLKKSMVEWLTRGPWRKWVVAYASARSCDGGAGATYVLLRRRPASRKIRKAGEKIRLKSAGKDL
ncbi:MAG TPA: Smr/MutS family protein [Thermodesulfobacteriota bacterium]|nr:Smr/MutS family protein [Thermodesulfobacteriota bacterium]